MGQVQIIWTNVIRSKIVAALESRPLEDPGAGFADGLVGSRPDLSKQGLELGEDLLDRVEVGGVLRQEREADSDKRRTP